MSEFRNSLMLRLILKTPLGVLDSLVHSHQEKAEELFITAACDLAHRVVPSSM